MSILKTGTSSTLVRAGVTAALALAAVGGLATSSQAVAAAQQALALSSTTGSSAGGQTLTLSLAATASPKFTQGFVGVQFQNTTSALAATATCSTNPTAAASNFVTAASVRYLATTKVSIPVPALSGGTTGYWLVCAYNAAAVSSVIPSTATVIGKANYLVATAPTATLVTPASGPAVGGQTITVTGSSFPTTIAAATPLTATLGGAPLTNITPISSSSFTATTPAHLTGAAALSVTTAGGTVTATGLFSFVNGITVSPNTTPSGVSVDVDIQGTGFSTLPFDTSVTPDNAGVSDTAAGDFVGTNSHNAHVYLVKGTYSFGAYDSTHNKTLGQSTECINPAVISDTELICTVDAAASETTGTLGKYVYATSANGGPGTALTNGAYTVTIVNDGGAVPTYQTVLSSGASFTVSDF